MFRQRFGDLDATRCLSHALARVSVRLHVGPQHDFAQSTLRHPVRDLGLPCTPAEGFDPSNRLRLDPRAKLAGVLIAFTFFALSHCSVPLTEPSGAAEHSSEPFGTKARGTPAAASHRGGLGFYPCDDAAQNVVVCGCDGYLRAFSDKIGVKFKTYNHWVASASTFRAALSAKLCSLSARSVQ